MRLSQLVQSTEATLCIHELVRTHNSSNLSGHQNTKAALQILSTMGREVRSIMQTVQSGSECYESFFQVYLIDDTSLDPQRRAELSRRLQESLEEVRRAHYRGRRRDPVRLYYYHENDQHEIWWHPGHRIMPHQDRVAQTLQALGIEKVLNSQDRFVWRPRPSQWQCGAGEEATRS